MQPAEVATTTDRDRVSTPEEMLNTATLERLIEACNSGDVERMCSAIDELVDPDVLNRTALPIKSTGAQAMKEVFTTLLRAFPDIHIKVDDLIAKGDKVVSRDVVTGTHEGEFMGIPATGKSVSYNEIYIARFVDGRVVETWGVVDALSLLRQLGVVAAK